MDTITLTNRDALMLYRAIHAVGGVVASIRFTYALGRTRRALQPVVDAIDEAQQAQHAKYLELAQAHAATDDSGEPIRESGDDRTGYRIDPERQAAFTAAVAPLNEQLAELLAEAVEVQVHRVPLDAVPDLAAAQVDALLPMLADG